MLVMTCREGKNVYVNCTFTLTMSMDIKIYRYKHARM